MPPASCSDALNPTPADQRPPDWRYRRAVADAAQHRYRPPAKTDFLVRALTNCLSQLNAAGDPTRRREVGNRSQCRRFRIPLALFENRERACQLEALVLARATPKSIAEQLELPITVVADYSALFFDVCSQLGDPTYIARYAIAAERERGAPETARRRVATKALAYFAGPKALREIGYLPTRDAIEYWKHPRDVVRKLATIQSIDGIADLISAMGEPPDPQAIAAMADGICAAVESTCSERYPEHMLAWAVQQSQPGPAPF